MPGMGDGASGLFGDRCCVRSASRNRHILRLGSRKSPKESFNIGSSCFAMLSGVWLPPQTKPRTSKATSQAARLHLRNKVKDVKRHSGSGVLLGFVGCVDGAISRSESRFQRHQ